MTDPIEAKVAELLDLLGIPYKREGMGGRHRLDFDCGEVFVEAKAAHTERTSEQMSRVRNIIVFQGGASVDLLLHAVRRLSPSAGR